MYDCLRKDEGITLVNSPEEYLRATELPHWYPLIEYLTPRSIWTEGRLDAHHHDILRAAVAVP